MRYLVTARVKPGRAVSLLRAIGEGSLGLGSVAGDEYLRDMESARSRALPGSTPPTTGGERLLSPLASTPRAPQAPAAAARSIRSGKKAVVDAAARMVYNLHL